MDFKHVYSMARKAPEFEGLTNKEFVIYRTAFRNGFRSGAALRQKIKKVIIPNKPADIPAGPVINNQKIFRSKQYESQDRNYCSGFCTWY